MTKPNTDKTPSEKQAGSKSRTDIYGQPLPADKTRPYEFDETLEEYEARAKRDPLLRLRGTIDDLLDQRDELLEALKEIKNLALETGYIGNKRVQSAIAVIAKVEGRIT